jgi:predicted nucleotide-binding protein (sugar kinase/HSP70/actin superfamily)
MYFFERFPFWRALLSRMRFGVKVSPRTDKAIAREGIERTVAEPCYPIQVAHGHVAALLEGGIDFLFLGEPDQLETIHTNTESHFCPWGQTLPFVGRGRAQVGEGAAAEAAVAHGQVPGGEKYMVEDLFECFGPLGFTRREIGGGDPDGYRRQARLSAFLRAAGRDAVERVEKAGADAIVLLGRPYNHYDRTST